MRHAVFITGTDTGVGKTVVTAALCHRFLRQRCSPGVMKPIETGVSSPTSLLSDAVRLKAAASSADELSFIRPYCFRAPVAPLEASRMERRSIDLKRVLSGADALRERHALLLVEGVGGLHVPLTTSKDVVDLIKLMQVPVIVVGRVGLGGVNHARLTLEALQRRRIRVLALVLNQTLKDKCAQTKVQERSTVRLLRERLDVPVIGPLPYANLLPRRWRQEVAALANTPAIKQLASLIDSSA